MKYFVFLKKISAIILFGLVFTLFAQSQELNSFRWTTLDVVNNPTGRHENAFVEYGGKFYLIGGRGINPVDVYDPKTNKWESLQKSPIEIHHFQPITYGNKIYLVGGMTGKYPVEVPLENIWIYYPEKDVWEKGPVIPEERRRGSTGAVIYNDKIYIVCGIKYGHTSGTSNYFDSYDLNTNQWEVLTDAPHIRDHFQAVVVNDKLYCIGGRNTSYHTKDNFNAFFFSTISNIDCYDFSEGKWTTLKNPLPIPTAAGSVVHLENKILYIGGEGSYKQAYNNTQVLDLTSGNWSQAAPLNIGRHGTSAILFDGDVFIAAGSQNRGGGNLTSMEVFSTNHNWKPLFNGKNFDGWEIKCREDDKNKNYWQVEDGEIICDTRGRKDHDYIWLQTRKEYDDFELRLKFQAPRENSGNSGVQVRSRYDDEAVVDRAVKGIGWMDGPQVDIDTKSPWRNGLIYDETRGHRRWIHPSLESWKIDSSEYAPKRVIYYWPDEGPGWNDLTIICNGVKILTYVNNILISDYDGEGILNDEYHKTKNVGTKGHIALQLHSNNDVNIRFKDIEIREL